MNNITPPILDTRIEYFLKAYVRRELLVGARKELLNICNMFAVLSMQVRTSDLMDEITNHLLSDSNQTK